MKQTMTLAEVDKFGCHLFKLDNVAKLLLEIDDRIDLMEQCEDGFKNVDGINLYELWRNLYAEIKEMWMADMNSLAQPL